MVRVVSASNKFSWEVEVAHEKCAIRNLQCSTYFNKTKEDFVRILLLPIVKEKYYVFIPFIAILIAACAKN